jgi:hypothetical protein
VRRNVHQDAAKLRAEHVQFAARMGRTRSHGVSAGLGAVVRGRQLAQRGSAQLRSAWAAGSHMHSGMRSARMRRASAPDDSGRASGTCAAAASGACHLGC